jgi:hypothetical protein
MTTITTGPVCLNELPECIVAHNIIPFLSSRMDMASLSSVSKLFRSIFLLQKYGTIWDELSPMPFAVCIDGYCPNCHLTRPPASVKSSLRFLFNFPIKRLRMHCFLTDIPACLEVLSTQSALQTLDLKLTNQTTSPSLDQLLDRSDLQHRLPAFSFRSLTTLSLNSSHLQHVKLAGRARLLELLGANLLVLNFETLSPSGVFSILEQRCPQLVQLRVDKALPGPDFEIYRNERLQCLELFRCHFIPTKFHFPNLTNLKFSAAFRLEDCQIKLLARSLPSQLTSLWLEIPGNQVNFTLRHLARSAPSALTSLVLEGCFESGTISTNILAAFGLRCSKLQALELTASKSMTSLKFESPDVLLELKTIFPLLTRLRVILDNIIMQGLPQFLADKESNSFLHLHVWAKRCWFPNSVWVSALRHFAELSQLFPSGNVHLDIL